ncbi:ABC transporter substrate-binding protein [Streptomyces sp. H10-C2]|uniref:ABC transporter substrate-binding protein n=1 Tax=unclassified Streptomyces TaxID=2593676 RepID=UPI0024BB76CC|nr:MULTISPECIES: ABC transporter substrate-binding protein [unclassified Streptomyces]MDJ0344084.1 ABC transporter substrate-binding protein [Streptomyces sp. PH10-H1]MDJ0368623.1 ABC transporter substrate-binding protein [Streptomyces sp. H10-C2]
MPTRGQWVTGSRLWIRWPWNVVLAVLVLALAGSTVTWVLWPKDTSCAAAVRQVGADGQCVGVTDGSYHFSDNLAAVSDLIRTQNEAVDKDGRSFVSIVYLMPMIPGPKDTTTPDSVRHEVQGAYSALYEADNKLGGGDVPRIRLLLANCGGTDEQRDAALEEIRGRIGPDHIVAVAGLGTSTDETARMIGKVTGDPESGGLQLAAVGSVITADTLAKIHGLVRTAPTNADEAAAAASFLKQPPYAGLKVLMVQDARADDQYSRTLGAAFLAVLPSERLAGQVEQYDSSQDGVATAFATRMANLCAVKPDVIYFAGRGVDLPSFLAPLKNRPCPDRKLIVLSGDDASQVAQAAGFDEIKETLRSGTVRLLYTGLAHPEAWARRPAAFPAPVTGASGTLGRKGYFQATFPLESLDDGQAIMGYDAVTTAVVGARLDSRTSNGRVTGSRMIQIWQSLHRVDAVHGASGYISFGNDGSPQDKAVPVIEIGADGLVHTLAVSSRTGTPFVPKQD